MRSLLAGLTLVFLAAACSSDSGDTTTVPTEPPGTVAPTTASATTVAPTTAPPATEPPVETTVPVALEACEIVTQADAEAVFKGMAQPLEFDDGGPISGAVSTCDWQPVDGLAILTFQVFEGVEFYGGAATFVDSEPIDLGDEGVIQVRSGDLGVDVQWIQEGLVLTIFADTLGLADTSTFEEDIRALAETISERLT